MRISDWSSDVCSSDLPEDLEARVKRDETLVRMGFKPSLSHIRQTYGGEWVEAPKPPVPAPRSQRAEREDAATSFRAPVTKADRKSVVQGKRVSVRLDHGGSRHRKKKKRQQQIR